MTSRSGARVVPLVRAEPMRVGLDRQPLLGEQPVDRAYGRGLRGVDHPPLVQDRHELLPVRLHAVDPSAGEPTEVNLPAEAGVQIELPPRVRGNGPFWNGWDGGFPTPHTERLHTIERGA